MKVTIQPVWSKLASDSDVPPEVACRLPSGWRLSSHQVETYKALTSGRADVVFNRAMTGDGKSLAGQLPTLVGGWKSPMMAMYPTNELVRDQVQQLSDTQGKWRTNLVPGLLNRSALDRIMAEGDYRLRGDALLGILRNHDVVLTNPDIFYLVMHQFYLLPDDARDRLIGPLMGRFGQLTFDEFHIFDTPQVIGVLNALLFLNEIGGTVRPNRYLFLSATPGEMMLEYLDRSGLYVKQVEGKYEHGGIDRDPGQWRQILQEATVHFDLLRAEEWVEQHTDDILMPFFLKHGAGAKGALIVNSVASANRLVEKLRPIFDMYGLTVKPNTGLTSQSGREASYAADLLVGTSTVDVGVDFQINFLVFESRDAGSFLQRLGRLGRHPGYERDGETHQFDEYVAYALVPPWIGESLFQGRDGQPALLQSDGMVDREGFQEAIGSAYPRTASFEAYARLWGELQTVRIMRGLSHSTIREQYRESRVRLGDRYEATFGIRLKAAFGRYKELRRTQKPLLVEAQAFRGGSYFTCCIVDEEGQGAERFKTADLFMLSANARLGPVDEEEFYLAAERAGLEQSRFKRDKPLGFYRMFGWRPERENIGVHLDRSILGWGADRFGVARAQKGFVVDAHVPDLNALNNRLARREIPANLCLGHHPMALKRRLRLPLLFAVYAFRSRDGVEGCVAFGREALLLEARLEYASLDCGGGPMVF